MAICDQQSCNARKTWNLAIMSDKPESPLGSINPSKLAKQLGNISRQAVQQWIAAGVVPAKRVLKVEELTGISRKVLNPKIYPD